jgi:hypothetical protein
MAEERRKRRYRMLRAGFTPQQVAAFVVSQYINEANVNLSKWSANYEDGIRKYIADKNKQGLASQKLTNWYTVLQGIIPDIVSAFTRAKSQYSGKKVVVTPLPVTPPPA